MIESRPMAIEDYLEIMELNAGVYPAWNTLDDDQKRYLGQINIESGAAKSFYEDGKLVAVGGVRFVGIGEAWMITPPQIRLRPFELFREVKKAFIKIRDENNLWRVFATSQISENFLRHLGFKKNEKPYTWTREL